MKHSNHSKKRAQQRAIPNEVIELLLTHGQRDQAGRGVQICYLKGKMCKSEFAQEAKSYGISDYERYISGYVVVAPDNTIVTVGHRTKRVLRNFDRPLGTHRLH